MACFLNLCFFVIAVSLLAAAVEAASRGRMMKLQDSYTYTILDENQALSNKGILLCRTDVDYTNYTVCDAHGSSTTTCHFMCTLMGYDVCTDCNTSLKKKQYSFRFPYKTFSFKDDCTHQQDVYIECGCEEEKRYYEPGTTGCTECPGGRQADHHNKYCLCRAGKKWSINDCFDCPKDTFSAAGAMNCTACPDGAITSDVGSGYCSCPAGQYWETSMCNPCPSGKYTDKANSTSCKDCPANSSSEIGQIKCDCDAGYIWNETLKYCKPCPAGFYRDSGSADCKQCPQLKTSYPGSEKCKSCGLGTKWDSFKCVKCEVGTKGNGVGCLPCPTGEHSNSHRTECLKNVGLSAILMMVVGVAVTLCIVSFVIACIYRYKYKAVSSTRREAPVPSYGSNDPAAPVVRDSSPPLYPGIPDPNAPPPYQS